MANEKRPKLAPRVYWKHGAYWYVARQPKGKWIRLGETEHEAYEALAELHQPGRHMLAVFEGYERDWLPKKGPETQKTQCRQLTNLKLAFGHMEPRKVKPSHIAAFHDEMGQAAPVSANRHLSLLSDVFRYALRKGAVDVNPCKGIGRHPETPRDRYVTDAELDELLPFADTWLRNLMELEYLTGQREGNLMRFLITELRDDALPFPPQKRGRRVEIERSEYLTRVVDRCKAYRATVALARKGKVVPLNLLVNSRGGRLTVSGVQSAVRRMWAAYDAFCEQQEKEGVRSKNARVPRFTLHDLRAKAGSDTDNEVMLGHKNVSTFRRVYARKPVKAKPTK